VKPSSACWSGDTIAVFVAVFSVRTAPKLTSIKCKTRANQPPFSTGQINKKFVVLCPKKCSRAKGIVYGTTLYTDNSSICMAAIHYGMLSDKGGEINFMIQPGNSYYIKSKGFGIQSQAKGPHIRSIKFLGKRSAIFYKWKDDYAPKFPDKWKTNVHPNAIQPLSNSWGYITDPNYIHNGNKMKLKAIVHTGNVRNKRILEYGSWISLRNADFANGKIKFNFLLFDFNPIALMFRYSDKNNYYAVEFSANNIQNVKLIKKVDGSSQLIQYKTFKILTQKWYRVVVIMDYDNIKVSIQPHKIRQHRTLFSKEIRGLSRGTISFATNGNSKFFINGVNIDEHKPNSKKKYKNNRRSWNSILRQLKYKERKIFCYGIFSNIKDEINRCIEIHNYCRIRCDKIIPTVENILNYSCQKDCVRSSNILENKKDEMSKLSKSGLWIPKPGDKCDYKPGGENSFRMCVIKNVTKGKKMKISLEYLADGMKSLKAEIKYPNPNDNLKRCGEALTARMDCAMK